MFELTVTTEGRFVARSTHAADEVRLGRGEACDVRLDAPQVALLEARIQRLDDVHVLEELGSGLTAVNGTRLRGHRRALADGDRIDVGAFAITFNVRATARVHGFALDLLLNETDEALSGIAFPVLVAHAAGEHGRAWVVPVGAPPGIPVAVTAGRAEGNDLLLDDPTVSKRHFALERDRDGWWVRDLGSLNGTLVDGRLAPANERVRLETRRAWIHAGPVVRVAFLHEPELRELLALARQRTRSGTPGPRPRVVARGDTPSTFRMPVVRPKRAGEETVIAPPREPVGR